LTKFYYNNSINEIKTIKNFFLYEVNASSPIHNSILIEPLLNLFVYLSNGKIQNSNCSACGYNLLNFEVEELVFAVLNKMLRFGYYSNNTFFQSYQSLPFIDLGYHLSIELWQGIGNEYWIKVMDKSGMMNANYTLSSFNTILSNYMYNPNLNLIERAYYCQSGASLS